MPHVSQSKADTYIPTSRQQSQKKSQKKYIEIFSKIIKRENTTLPKNKNDKEKGSALTNPSTAWVATANSEFGQNKQCLSWALPFYQFLILLTFIMESLEHF